VSTTSPKLGLTVPSTSDTFSTSVIATNYGLIDSSAGIWSGTYSALTSKVASYTSSQTGMTFWDTTNNVHWVWNGSSLIRPTPKGLIGQAVLGTKSVTYNLGTSQVLGSVTPFTTAPLGGRKIRVDALISPVSVTSGSGGIKFSLVDTNNLYTLNTTSTYTTMNLNAGMLIQGYYTPSNLTLSVSLTADTLTTGAAASVAGFTLSIYEV